MTQRVPKIRHHPYLRALLRSCDYELGEGRHAVTGRAVINNPPYKTPLYHKAEPAHIIAVPAQTFRDWAVGYARKRLDGSHVVSAPIVTTLEPARPQGVSVPFVGLAAAYIVAAFTKAGLPMQRLRPAVMWLQDHIGLPRSSGQLFATT